ncbi:DNA sulfur modification protein DndD [Lysinibacillus fusiformis]|uniref:DNA sulfur modification protein DndD n=1 Tax=Lysinibacillus fusiformis TaxID=28031 RepID=UPI0035C09D4C
MYLKNISLVNIGAYKDYNFFNFKTASNKNVLLIGGENGAGKTTLLNAIKLGLFGSYGFGYKTENPEYYKHVESILNNNAKREGTNEFSIKIQFSIVDNLKYYDYELKREWNFSNDSLKESYFLMENGIFLEQQQKELFNLKLRDIMPPQLLDFCLFDGEEIARIVTQNTLSAYIKKLSKVVFNLELFEALEVDLEQYSKQNINQTKIDSIEETLYIANSKEKELRNQINTTIRSLEYKEQDLQKLTEEYLEVKSSFEKYGGLKKQEREDMLTKISTIELQRKQRIDQIKQFVSSYLPFYLMSNLVTETRTQLKNEESLQLTQQLDKKLSPELLASFLKNASLNGSNEQITILKNKLLQLFKPSEHAEMIHGASFAESLEVEQIYNLLKKDLPAENLSLIHQNNEELKLLQELKAKVNVHDSTDEFGKILEQMDEYNNKIILLQQEVEKEKELLIEHKNKLSITIDQIESIKSELHKFNKTSGSFLEAQKIITLSRRYREIQIKQKLQDVQIQATQNLKKMLRKHDYISLIQIDPENYEVTLLDAYQNELEKRTLSAGEKQILLISIIWAIFKCSGRQVPFIFDTLLGRLDKTHKAAVLSIFIPNFGKQAIILSTDSEIDEEHYNILSPYISHEYTLNFDPIKQQTYILKDYFKFKE